ncbi:uncharacterized protein IWZ02DRAFT_81125 [Phyllosticta citriasiana]|uniref:uncharacterized protein n=1 Tax=Phyllosticta citriasiana TaxID=595635 RepID=UPI0030FD34EA
MTCLRCAPGPKSAPFRIGTKALAIKTSVTGKAARHPDLSDKSSTDCQAARQRCSSKKACDAMPWIASNCLWEASRGSSVLRRLCRVPVVGRSCLGRCRPAAGGSSEGTDAKRRHVCDAPPPQRTHRTTPHALLSSSHLTSTFLVVLRDQVTISTLLSICSWLKSIGRTYFPRSPTCHCLAPMPRRCRPSLLQAINLSKLCLLEKGRQRNKRKR